METRLPIPNDLPNNQIGELSYEQGYDEKLLVEASYADCFLCPICHGIPRQPVSLKTCGHFFCECCIDQVMQLKRKQHPDACSRSLMSECAVCKKPFSSTCPIPFEELSIALKKMYHLVKLHCPYGCNFIGDPREMDEHQSFQCEFREVTCPSVRCGEKMTFQKLRDDHLAKCTRLMVYCDRCNLAVSRKWLENHDCMRRMARAMFGMCILTL